MIWDVIPEGHAVVLCSPAPFLIQGNAIKVQTPQGNWIQGKITAGCPFFTHELSDKHLQDELTRWHQADFFSEVSSLYEMNRKLVLLLLRVM